MCSWYNWTMEQERFQDWTPCEMYGHEFVDHDGNGRRVCECGEAVEPDDVPETPADTSSNSV